MDLVVPPFQETSRWRDNWGLSDDWFQHHELGAHGGSLRRLGYRCFNGDSLCVSRNGWEMALEMEVLWGFQLKIIYKWKIFQLAMFDCQRVYVSFLLLLKYWGVELLGSFSQDWWFFNNDDPDWFGCPGCRHDCVHGGTLALFCIGFSAIFVGEPCLFLSAIRFYPPTLVSCLLTLHHWFLLSLPFLDRWYPHVSWSCPRRAPPRRACSLASITPSLKMCWPPVDVYIAWFNFLVWWPASWLLKSQVKLIIKSSRYSLIMSYPFVKSCFIHFSLICQSLVLLFLCGYDMIVTLHSSRLYTPQSTCTFSSIFRVLTSRTLLTSRVYHQFGAFNP